MSLDVQGPDKFDATLQNPMLDAVAAAAPDALLVAPNDRKASAGPLADIQEAGTKVVLVDTIVDDPSIGVSRIATDNYLGGVKAAEALDDPGRAKRRQGARSSRPTRACPAWTRAWRASTRRPPSSATCSSRRPSTRTTRPATAAQIISAQLAGDPDLAGVFATNLFTAQGVATGVKQAGATDVKVVGFDAGPDQIKQLEAGDVQALVAQKPYNIGVEGIEQAVAALTGGETTPRSRPSRWW